MPRIRSIKPTFFTSLQVANLGPEARLTFVGVWTYVDDYGVGVDDARLVKAAVWPLDDRTAADVEEDLAAIEATGMLCRYEADGKPLLHVVNWDEHQTISHKGKPSGTPCPRHSGESPETLRSAPEDFRSPPETLRPEGKGREKGKGKGTEGSAAAPPAPPPPPGGALTTSAARQLCDQLAGHVHANGSPQPTVTRRWLEEAERLLRVDRRPYDETVRLIDWCQTDDFWRGVILTMPKFREKYDTIRLQSQRAGPRPGHLSVVADSNVAQGDAHIAEWLASRAVTPA